MATVLVVDDEPSITEVLSIVLTRAGHKVLTANSLDEAKGMLDVFKFQVILTDFHLSATDRGTELSSYGTPLILMSAGMSDDDLRRYRNDFDIFVPKPFASAEIKDSIEVLLDI